MEVGTEMDTFCLGEHFNVPCSSTCSFFSFSFYGFP